MSPNDAGRDSLLPGAGTLADLIDAVVVADLFDSAVTLDEVLRYARARTERTALRAALADPDGLGRLVSERAGFYCLRGRERLLDAEPKKRERAGTLLRRARTIAGALSHVPHVRGLLVTGSVAAGSAESGADVDLLVLVTGERLATVFALLGTLAWATRHRVFCPNYYLAEDHLQMQRRDAHVAREVVQGIPVSGSAGRVRSANSWTAEFFPNAAPQRPPASEAPRRTRMQALLERGLAGRLGDLLEAAARGLARWRLAVHHLRHGATVPPDADDLLARGIELRFHASDKVPGAAERYRKRRAEMDVAIAAGRWPD